MELPKVTILIVNHNYDKYVLDAIDSALQQNYPTDKLSIIIVDDASTDESLVKISDKYFDGALTISSRAINNTVFNGIKITFIQGLQQMGPSFSRNIAIQNTIGKTDIYAILDADDTYYPDKVLKCVSKMIESKDIGVAYADYDILNVETGNLVREFKEPYSKQRLMEECIVHSGALIKKEALQAVQENGQYYDNEMRTCEDYDLWIRISEHFIIIHVPEALSLVRVHNNNSTSTVAKEVWARNWQRIRNKIAQRNVQ